MKDDGNWFRGFPSVAFADDDHMVVALGDSGVRIWETTSGKLVHDIICLTFWCERGINLSLLQTFV